MAVPPYVERGNGGQRRQPLDAGRLWAGGPATALVAALIVVVGIAIGSLVSGAARSAIQLGRQSPRLRER